MLLIILVHLKYFFVVQIIAIYEEQDVPSVPHNGGDGTSASSVGTSSPELFNINPEYLNNNEKNLLSMSWRNGNKNDVIITHNDLSLGKYFFLHSLLKFHIYLCLFLYC